MKSISIVSLTILIWGYSNAKWCNRLPFKRTRCWSFVSQPVAALQELDRQVQELRARVAYLEQKLGSTDSQQS